MLLRFRLHRRRMKFNKMNIWILLSYFSVHSFHSRLLLNIWHTLKSRRVYFFLPCSKARVPSCATQALNETYLVFGYTTYKYAVSACTVQCTVYTIHKCIYNTVHRWFVPMETKTRKLLWSNCSSFLLQYFEICVLCPISPTLPQEIMIQSRTASTSRNFPEYEILLKSKNVCGHEKIKVLWKFQKRMTEKDWVDLAKPCLVLTPTPTSLISSFLVVIFIFCMAHCVII